MERPGARTGSAGDVARGGLRDRLQGGGLADEPIRVVNDERSEALRARLCRALAH